MYQVSKRSDHLTGLEVRMDAHQIFEEFLDWSSENRGSNIVGRSRSDPHPNKVNLKVSDAGQGKVIFRSQTIPPIHRGSEGCNPKKDNQVARKENNHTVSSADSEGEKPQSVSTRKKKSPFKRAKERLVHLFHRDQKTGLAKNVQNNQESPSSKKKKSKPETTRAKKENNTQTASNGTHNGSKHSTQLHTACLEGEAHPRLAEGTKECNDDILLVGCSSSTKPATPTSSSNYALSDDTKDSIPNILSSIQSNALDSPADDISFIDVEDNINTPNPPELSKTVKQPSLKHRTCLSQLHDVIATHQTAELGEGAVIMCADVSITVPEEDVPDGFNAPLVPTAKDSDLKHPNVEGPNKEVPYGKIAKKLAEMADSYSSGLSDPRGATAATPDSLSTLENEIMMCLRDIGDRNSTHLNVAIEEVEERTTQEAYQRFRSTVQNSIGTEISWNHLAFLFYTTKGVISAVGRGSKVASKAKEFTLQYITDTCASWIMDQGGFVRQCTKQQ
ncbi:uncharacterized protein LOC131931203 isoform X2 [Physella acuta]|uniref:uncharacterized protein LOC131931203 isoform X2 n=1 Tax=Physella acuta TaxID=109671 RepID=UPI0027DC9175|nr:uncharacterized protein LOC131931203 isoform X2 [Physella acuta]